MLQHPLKFATEARPIGSPTSPQKEWPSEEEIGRDCVFLFYKLHADMSAVRDPLYCTP